MKQISDKTASRLLAYGMTPVNGGHREQARAAGFWATLYLLLAVGMVALGLFFGGL